MYKRLFEFVWVFAVVVLFPVSLISIVPGRVVNENMQEQTLATDAPFDATSPREELLEIRFISVLHNNNIMQMELEDYVLHVVLAEMPASFETEALKAQAVVVRTYTMRRQQGNLKHDNASVCTDPGCCQAYKSPSTFLAEGGMVTDLERVAEAVKSTQGEVLRYNGDLIEATYFSCSGGVTEDAAAVWGADVPYLKSTESPGEEGTAYFVNTVYFTSKEFQTALGCELSGEPGTWFGAVTYTNGQGVNLMQIGNRTFKGTTLRQLLDLRSTAFVITAIGDTIVITTKGYGHRVGMSQYGADAMAVAGKSYREILAHYYAGTNLTHISID